MSRRLVLAVAVLAIAAPSANARKVLNPTNALGGTLSAFTVDVHDGKQHVDQAGLSQPFITGASVDAAGVLAVPTFTLPVVPIPDVPDTAVDCGGFTCGHYRIHDAAVTLTVDQPPAGSLDPFTGAATLSGAFHLKLAYKADWYATGSGYGCGNFTCGTIDPQNCTVGTAAGPIALHLTTSTPGAAYNESDGSLTLADATFALPGVTGDCGAGGPGGYDLTPQINQALGLPSPAGHNLLHAAGTLNPILRRGVIAALSATPAQGTAPLNVTLDASATQAPAGVQSYAFDADGDGSFESSGTSPTLATTVGAGPHTLRVRVTDVDGDADVASTTVTVEAPVTPVSPATLGTLPVPSTGTTAPPVVSAQSLIRMPVARHCLSRRTIRITLRPPSGVGVRRLSMRVGKRRARVFTGKALAAPVDLRGLPNGSFKVTVVATLSDGRTLTLPRTYRTCAPKRRH